MAGSFELDLRGFGQLTRLRANTVLRKVALDLLSSVVAGRPVGVGTPVDTGRARGGWQVDLNEFPPGTDTPLDKGGEQTIQAGNSVIAEAQNTDTIYIGNNVTYITILEYGRDDGTPGSPQAPQGMLRVAIRAYQSLVADAVKSAGGE